MKKHQLASQLRQRQLTRLPDLAQDLVSHFSIPYEQARQELLFGIERLSDADIIDSYIKCAGCGAHMVDARTNARLIWQAHNAQEWIDLTGAYDEQHTRGERVR